MGSDPPTACSPLWDVTPWDLQRAGTDTGWLAEGPTFFSCFSSTLDLSPGGGLADQSLPPAQKQLVTRERS